MAEITRLNKITLADSVTIGTTTPISNYPVTLKGTFANKNGIHFATENGVAGAIRLTDYYSAKASNRPALEIYGTPNSDVLSTAPAISIISDGVTVGGEFKSRTYAWATPAENKTFPWGTANGNYMFSFNSDRLYYDTGFVYKIGYSNSVAPAKDMVRWANSSDLATRYFFYDGKTYLGSDLTTTPVAPNSTLQVNGSLSCSYVAKTANYTLTSTDYTVDCTSGTFTITLPTAVGITGRIYNIKNSGTGVITVDADGSETIDGATTATLAIQYESIKIQSTGAGWIII